MSRKPSATQSCKTVPWALTSDTNGERVTIFNQLGDSGYNAIESVAFADGTILDSAALRNRLVSEMKETGVVVGSERSEAYTHALGDGSYTIMDYDFGANGTDTLSFAGINSADVQLSRFDEDLIFTLSNGEQVALVNQLGESGYFGIESVSVSYTHLTLPTSDLV